MGSRINPKNCFKSNYKSTSFPDATLCKTILSLNIIDTAQPYCSFGNLSLSGNPRSNTLQTRSKLKQAMLPEQLRGLAHTFGSAVLGTLTGEQ